MLLLAYGIYVLASSTLRISPRYGAEGRGARVGGVICVVAGLVLQLALGLSGVAFDLTLLASLLAIFVVVPLALVLVVHVYGNAYAESSQTTLCVREVPEPGTSDPEARRIIDEARRRGDRLRRLGLVLIGIIAGGVLAAIVGGLFSGGLVAAAHGVGGQAIMSLRVRRNMSHESECVRVQLRRPSPPSFCSSILSLSR